MDITDPPRNDSKVYLINVSLVGREWTVELTTFAPTTNQSLTVKPIAKGDTITLDVPLNLLSELPRSFEWKATTHWDFRESEGEFPLLVAGMDRVPNEGRAGFGSFPRPSRVPRSLTVGAVRNPPPMAVEDWIGKILESR